MNKIVAIAADHGGFYLKNDLMARLKDSYSITDLGAHEFDATDDFPDYAFAVASTVAAGKAWKGIILCGSGVGACIAANKIKGARACVCHDTYSAHQGVEHDDMNILCLGARIIGLELAIELTEAFLKASFKNEERFLRRLNRIKSIDK